jgi:hypothetical protein
MAGCHAWPEQSFAHLTGRTQRTTAHAGTGHARNIGRQVHHDPQAAVGVGRVRDQGEGPIGGGLGWRGCQPARGSRRRARPAGVHRQFCFGVITAPGQAHDQPSQARRHCKECFTLLSATAVPFKSTRSYVPHCRDCFRGPPVATGQGRHCHLWFPSTRSGREPPAAPVAASHASGAQSPTAAAGREGQRGINRQAEVR